MIYCKEDNCLIRTEEFIRHGKIFIYIDIPKLMSSGEAINIFEEIRQALEKYTENPIYAIVNIEYVMFDAKIIETAAKYMEYYKPYVKFCVLVGIDGIKKILVNSIVKRCGGNNIGFAFTKNQAIALLLQQPS